MDDTIRIYVKYSSLCIAVFYIFGYSFLYIYYDNWGIDIINYLSFDDLFFYGIKIFLSLIKCAGIIYILYNIKHLYKWLCKKCKLLNINLLNHHKQIFNTFYYLLPLVIFTQEIYFLFNIVAILLILFCYAIIAFYRKTDKFDYKNTFNLIGFVSFFLMLFILIGSTLLKENIQYKTISINNKIKNIILKENTILIDNNDNFLIGEMKNYLFIYNKKDNELVTLNRTDVIKIIDKNVLDLEYYQEKTDKLKSDIETMNKLNFLDYLYNKFKGN